MCIRDRKLRVRFEKSFLGGFFDLRTLTEKLAGNLKHSRAVPAHYLLERLLVSRARQADQLQV